MPRDQRQEAELFLKILGIGERHHPGWKAKWSLASLSMFVLMHAELPATAGQPTTKSLIGIPVSLPCAAAATSIGLSAAPAAWPAANAQQSSDKLVQALIQTFDVLRVS